jgi:phosphatidate cytidylyltransferase
VISRVAVAVPGIALAVAVVILGGIAFALVCALVAVLALYELYNLTAAFRPLRWAGYVGALATVLLAWAFASPEHGVLLGLGLAIGLTAVGGLILTHREDVMARMTVTLFGAVYVGLPLGILVAARELSHGAAIVANILVGTWVFDTASYVGGRLWGSHPVAPRVSPGKTVEGLVIGLAVGTLGVWVAQLYESWISGIEAVALGAIICVAAFVGDLTESMIKRDVQVKDSGKLLLGHGGVLDRFDGLLFSAIAGYFATVWLVG